MTLPGASLRGYFAEMFILWTVRDITAARNHLVNLIDPMIYRLNKKGTIGPEFVIFVT